MTSGFSIRLARADDAPELARLANELGYPTEADEMRRRLGTLVGRPDHTVFVAEGRDSAAAPMSGSAGRPRALIVGWLHVGRCIMLESGESAEILGLVVDGSARRGGVGRRLVASAEDWSRAAGLDRIVVRSNVVREESHRFYPALDFALSKSQRVYVKKLG